MKVLFRKRRTKKTFGFTLVELIVVITILVILGTIAFISIGGYSLSARDATRISDITNIKKALELTVIKTSSYPMPTNGSGVTFSGGLVWTEGSIGDSVVIVLNAAGFKLSKKSTDPMYQNTEYTYSLLGNGKEYQVGTIVEDSATAQVPFLDLVYAAGTPLSAYVAGNYNGLVARTQTGAVTYYLTLPSIVLQNLSNTELTNQTTQSGNLVMHKKGNLPHTYGSNNISGSPSITFTALSTSNQLTNGSGILAYTTTGALDTSGAMAMMTNLYTIYSGSNLKSDTISAGQVAGLINGGATSAALVATYNSSISKSVGALPIASSPAVGSYSPGQPYSPTIDYTATQTFTYNGATVTVSATGMGISTSKYLNCPSFDVGVWQFGDTAPQIWSLCNVGATSVFNGTQTGAVDSPVSTAAEAGKLFQWGENVAWTYGVSTVTTADNCTWSRDAQVCVASAGLSAWPATISDVYDNGPSRWFDWGGSGATADTRGPCAPGYHVPMYIDWKIAGGNLLSRDILSITLKLPMAGNRSAAAGAFGMQGGGGYYWSSEPSTFGAGSGLMFTAPALYNWGQIMNRVSGFSVRCIRN